MLTALRSACAVTMLEMVDDGHPDADLSFADSLMKEIPKLTKKIAGKSLPIEVSREHVSPIAEARLTGVEIGLPESTQIRVTGTPIVPACS